MSIGVSWSLVSIVSFGFLCPLVSQQTLLSHLCPLASASLFPLLGAGPGMAAGHHTLMAGLNLGSPPHTLQHLPDIADPSFFLPGKSWNGRFIRAGKDRGRRSISDVEKTRHVEDAFAWDGAPAPPI